MENASTAKASGSGLKETYMFIVSDSALMQKTSTDLPLDFDFYELEAI